MRLTNLIAKYSKHLLLVALVLSSIAISIRSKDGEVHLILQEYPILIFLLIVISSILVAAYFKFTNNKIASQSNKIRTYSEGKIHDLDAQLSNLTERQKEVYEMIISGKTNKEIMSLLFIEQSTLKSHINQIYRKLNIQSRNELKSRANDT